MGTRLTVLAAVALTALAAYSGTARSAGGLGITFDQPAAHAGDWVTGTGITPWSGGTAGITAYLAPTRLPAFKPDYNGIQPTLAKPPAHGVWRLARPTVLHRRLRIRFRVPKVPPGDYTFAFECADCAPGGDFFLQTLWGTKWSAKPGVVLRVSR